MKDLGHDEYAVVPVTRKAQQSSLLAKVIWAIIFLYWLIMSLPTPLMRGCVIPLHLAVEGSDVWFTQPLTENMNLSGPKFVKHSFYRTETVKEEAARGGDSVVRESAQEPGGALGQDGHFRGVRQGKEADWWEVKYGSIDTDPRREIAD